MHSCAWIAQGTEINLESLSVCRVWAVCVVDLSSYGGPTESAAAKTGKLVICLRLTNPGPLFTKKTPSYQYRDSHYKPETVVGRQTVLGL